MKCLSVSKVIHKNVKFMPFLPPYIEHRAIPEKLNRKINNACAENMTFGEAAISEDISCDFNAIDLHR